MTPINDNRNHWLNIRLTEAEHSQMMNALNRTTDKKLSSYARKLLLGKPVKVVYRNATLDDFMKEMLLLRKDLNGIGNNFNQLVKRINSVKLTPEIVLLVKYSRQIQAQVLEKTEAIRSNIEKFSASWYQNL